MRWVVAQAVICDYRVTRPCGTGQERYREVEAALRTENRRRTTLRGCPEVSHPTQRRLHPSRGRYTSFVVLMHGRLAFTRILLPIFKSIQLLPNCGKHSAGHAPLTA
ncbi:hypothetical protein PsYK624_067090 [Phanerochaete sordida]|uniref:Uncharacterized protein n=1 Tax=Phanerochaete sordida TaxID=48140 RepID=A0A9P3LCJ6_9APHY|nr:hypothetical protein PsYK624_067090 [Phanerochaete sordida]